VLFRRRTLASLSGRLPDETCLGGRGENVTLRGVDAPEPGCLNDEGRGELDKRSEEGRRSDPWWSKMRGGSGRDACDGSLPFSLSLSLARDTLESDGPASISSVAPFSCTRNPDWGNPSTPAKPSSSSRRLGSPSIPVLMGSSLGLSVTVLLLSILGLSLSAASGLSVLLPGTRLSRIGGGSGSPRFPNTGIFGSDAAENSEPNRFEGPALWDRCGTDIDNGRGCSPGSSSGPRSCLNLVSTALLLPPILGLVTVPPLIPSIETTPPGARVSTFTVVPVGGIMLHVGKRGLCFAGCFPLARTVPLPRSSSSPSSSGSSC